MIERMTKALAVSAMVCAAAAYPSAAMAQQRPAPPASPRPGAARPAPRPQTAIRGFGDFGAERFAAGDTFDATLGSPTGVFFGEQTVDAACEAIERFEREADRFDPRAARRQALLFRKERFESELFAYLDGVLRGRPAEVRKAA